MGARYCLLGKSCTPCDGRANASEQHAAALNKNEAKGAMAVGLNSTAYNCEVVADLGYKSFEIDGQ